MTPVRHLFTSRLARPKLEATVRALVRTAVYLAAADGKVEEPEVEALVDHLRAVMARAVGAENVDEYATVPVLLDTARAATRALHAEGEAAYVAGIAEVLEGDFRRDALKLAVEVVRANGTISAAEKRAAETLARALGVPAGDVLDQL
ncbi:MAG: TerB family tellurite resistance protein [Myxococcus sp.]|nr:TerB family tellurite resistance protein [Myxococcus sp.]